MNSPPWLLIPVRSLSDGKRRLAARLDAPARRALNEQFLDHLLEEATFWPELAQTVVVSPCEEVLRRARTAGARALRQPELPRLDEISSETLNAALELARRELQRWGTKELMVVSSDLPWMGSADLESLADCSRDVEGRRRVVIATDRAGHGTNALYLPCGASLPFRFGLDSARHHGNAARVMGFPVARVVIPGLAFDVDTPADLDVLWQLEQNCA